jgi:hypothetical protein
MSWGQPALSAHFICLCRDALLVVEHPEHNLGGVAWRSSCANFLACSSRLCGTFRRSTRRILPSMLQTSFTPQPRCDQSCPVRDHPGRFSDGKYHRLAHRCRHSGAFGVALYLLSVQMRDRHDERLRSQARLVAAWLDELRTEPHEDGKQPEFSRAIVIVQNESNEPIYRVVIRIGLGVSGSFVRHPGILGPHEGRILSILLPGSLRADPAPEVMFFDRAGVIWIRNGHTGKLSQVDKIDDMLAFQRADPGAYPSVDAHPILRLVVSPEDHRGQRRPL